MNEDEAYERIDRQVYEAMKAKGLLSKAVSYEDYVAQTDSRIERAPVRGKYACSLINMVDGFPITVTHGLDTVDIVVSVYEIATGKLVCDSWPEIHLTGANTITVLVPAEYSGPTLRIVIVG